MLYVLLFVLIGLGALLSLVAAFVALGAYFNYRRARLELQVRLASEVESLARRTGELEIGVAALQERSARLPVSIAEIQHSLSTLRVLTGALAVSLRQAQRVLSLGAIKDGGAARPGDATDGRPG